MNTVEVNEKTVLDIFRGTGILAIGEAKLNNLLSSWGSTRETEEAMGHKEKILDFLRANASERFSISEIVSRTGVEPHSQVFQITASLKNKNRIQGEQGERHDPREWVFWIPKSDAGEKSSPTPRPVETDVLLKATPTITTVQESNVSVSFKMKSLVDIGFRKVGEWKMLSESISPNIFDLANATNILYAFIADGEVLYVGKTAQTLQKRLYGYQNPGPSQKTNIKVNPLLRELLVQDKSVDIYAFPDDGLWYIGDFHLNLAAGLEDGIISILKPKWNG